MVIGPVLPMITAADESNEATDYSGLPYSTDLDQHSSMRREKITAAEAHPWGSKKKSQKSKRKGKGKKSQKNDTQSDKKEDQCDDHYGWEAGHANSSAASLEAGTVATEVLAEPHQQRKLPQPPLRDDEKDTYIYVSVLPHYEYRTVPHVGSVGSVSGDLRIQEKGLFVTQMLEQGTRIICEPPLLEVLNWSKPTVQSLSLYQLYLQLEAHDQQAVWSLTPSDVSASPFLSRFTKALISKLRPIYAIANKPPEQRTEQDAIRMAIDLPMLAQSAEMCRISARWHAHRYLLIPQEELLNDFPEDVPVAGLFLETSKLRHSCIPNCYGHYNEENDRMTVHVTKTVYPGEELTMTALQNVYYMEASHRAEKLYNALGITCTCSACDPSHPNFVDQEKNRLTAHGRAILLKHTITQLDILDSDTILADLALTQADRDPNAIPTLDDLRNAEHTCIELINNLKNAGCASTELIRWYTTLIERILPRIAQEVCDEEGMQIWYGMLDWANECERLARVCFGEDSEDYWEIRERAGRIEGFVRKQEGGKGWGKK